MMNNTEHPHPMGESHHSHGQTPYWRRAHHDWRFWFGLIAMLVAIGIYVGTNDLSMRLLAVRSRCRPVAEFRSIVRLATSTKDYAGSTHGGGSRWRVRWACSGKTRRDKPFRK